MNDDQQSQVRFHKHGRVIEAGYEFLSPQLRHKRWMAMPWHKRMLYRMRVWWLDLQMSFRDRFDPGDEDDEEDKDY